MSYLSRKKIYQELESIRKSPMISYVTSIRPGCTAQMAQDVLPMMIQQINKLSHQTDAIDLFILSNGGDPIAAWRIISLLREKFQHITVLIPYTALSAATLLALGADEIIMHPFGNLGPIDPQLNFVDNQGKPKTISYEDIIKYMEFVKDVGITNQELLQKSFEKLTAEIPPTAIGFAKRSAQLGLIMGQKLLATHMDDEEKAKNISETLNTKFYHHGYPLGKKEAKEIGLPIAESNQQIEDLMWNIYEDFTNEMELNNVFNPEAIMTQKIFSLPIPHPNTINRVTEKVKLACLESTHLNCYIEQELVATYSLAQDNSVTTNITVNQGNWMTEVR